MIRQEGLRRSGSGSARSASIIPLWPVSFGEVRLLNDIERYQFIGGLHMQVFSLLWGIVAIIGMLIGFVPLLGALNWLNIPCAGVGIIFSAVGVGGSRGLQANGCVSSHLLYDCPLLRPDPAGAGRRHPLRLMRRLSVVAEAATWNG